MKVPDRVKNLFPFLRWGKRVTKQSAQADFFAGLLLVAIVPLIGPLTAYLPRAAIAGLLILVAWRPINFAEIRNIPKADKNDEAIAAIFSRLDKSICAKCENRIFTECRTIDQSEPES